MANRVGPGRGGNTSDSGYEDAFLRSLGTWQKRPNPFTPSFGKSFVCGPSGDRWEDAVFESESIVVKQEEETAHAGGDLEGAFSSKPVDTRPSTCG